MIYGWHKHFFKKPAFLLVIILTTLAWTLYQIEFVRWFFTGNPIMKQYRATGFLVNTRGCRIQDLEKEDPYEAKRWVFQDEMSFNCNKDGGRDPVVSTRDSLYVVVDVLTDLNVTNASCCYRQLLKDYLNDTCVPFRRKVKIPYEFVRVGCSGLNKDGEFVEFYRDYFAFPQPADYYRRRGNFQARPPGEDRLNVLILGVDGVSRLNFHRQIPSVMDFLEARDSVELLGYNAVGENTFANLMPLLGGVTETELVQTCWQDDTKTFDDCNFIWNHFKRRGYITGFGEDSAEIGLFNYQKMGFKKSPTDFYTFHYNYKAEQEIGTEHWLNCDLCVGRRPTFYMVLDYALKFTMNLNDTAHFGFFWINSISHDLLHLPHYTSGPLVSFLEQLEKNCLLNATVVILMSDHGIRWGPIRSTYRGYMEARLPGLFLLFPRWFKVKYGDAYANLRQNRRRLTTSFDVHETLLDLADLTTRVQDDAIRERSKNPRLGTRGQSLFLSVSTDRTCEDVEISPHWCACYKTENVSVTLSIVPKLANMVVHFINDLLAGFTQCSKLSLHEVRGARVELLPVHQDGWAAKAVEKDYVITVETLPGRGLFEASVRQLAGGNNFAVLPSISRVNLYGNQSSCVTDFHVKQYCYCVSIFGEKGMN